MARRRGGELPDVRSVTSKGEVETLKAAKRVRRSLERSRSSEPLGRQTCRTCEISCGLARLGRGCPPSGCLLAGAESGSLGWCSRRKSVGRGRSGRSCGKSRFGKGERTRPGSWNRDAEKPRLSSRERFWKPAQVQPGRRAPGLAREA